MSLFVPVFESVFVSVFVSVLCVCTLFGVVSADDDSAEWVGWCLIGRLHSPKPEEPTRHSLPVILLPNLIMVLVMMLKKIRMMFMMMMMLEHEVNSQLSTVPI